jgi:outer membrane protein assembly factor BamB
MAHDRVESVWPVHGSALVAGGVVYCTAGRSSFIDGGIRLYALDAATGRVLDEKVIHEIQKDDRPSAHQMPEDVPGARSDILTTDGTGIYMLGRKLDLSPAPKAGPGEHLFETDGHLNPRSGFFDRFWFHRVAWAYGRSAGNMIAFDESATYSVIPWTNPGGANYRLYVPRGGDRELIPDGLGSKELDVRSVLKWKEKGVTPTEKDKGHVQARVTYGGHLLRKREGKRIEWELRKFGVCPVSMVVTTDKLLVAGFVDAIDPTDPWAKIEGRKDSVLWVLSASDGRKLAEYALDTLPVWNGMAAARGKVYLSLRNGSLVCLGP